MKLSQSLVFRVGIFLSLIPQLVCGWGTKKDIFLGRENKNILLIINYNHAHYESIPLLKEIYSPYFKNIVFYGPKKHKNVNFCAHNRGYLSYICIADAMKRYPHCDGYLFLMDDCILNAPLLKNLDTSKIWYLLYGFLNPEQLPQSLSLDKGPNATEWCWWHTQWGCKPITAAFNKIPDHYKKVLAQNWGESNVVAAYSDIVYIPSQYKEQYSELATLFCNQAAFLESALPTIISCLDSKNNWIWLQGHGTYGKQPYKRYKFNVYFNHPLKLSEKKNRAFVRKLFKKMKKQIGKSRI